MRSGGSGDHLNAWARPPRRFSVPSGGGRGSHVIATRLGINQPPPGQENPAAGGCVLSERRVPLAIAMFANHSAAKWHVDDSRISWPCKPQARRLIFLGFLGSRFCLGFFPRAEKEGICVFGAIEADATPLVILVIVGIVDPQIERLIIGRARSKIPPAERAPLGLPGGCGLVTLLGWLGMYFTYRA